MSPLTHLVASWLVAVTTTDNPRDRKLVTVAGVLPDADGLGIVRDVIGSWISGKDCTFYYYQQYHHMLMHGWPGAVVSSVLLAIFARRRLRVLGLCLLTFHLHLFCDLLGSRGPTPGDIWPIYYSEPVFRFPIWFWRGQWRLDGWQNEVIFMLLFFAALFVAIGKGFSFVELFSKRADTVFVNLLRNWCSRVAAKWVK